MSYDEDTKPLFGKSSAANYEVYLNLTPLMDVMSNILFFLLSAFGASAVAVFSISVPVTDNSAPAASNNKQEDIAVTLTVEPTQLIVGCSGSEDETSLKICHKIISNQQQKMALINLQQHLIFIKNRFAHAKTLVVLPEKTILYQQLVKIVDTARSVKQSSGAELSLLPEVVFSSLVE